MKVTIKEKLYDYVLDYPNGWQSSTGDYFKCPVMIGDIKCFIKRFEKKTPRDITGWELLHRLKHKNESNLPRIYDIVNVDEKGRAIYYVFYEFLKGVSLEDQLAGEGSIDLERLATDLFSAIGSFYKYNYWITDFTEKNILIQDTGRIVLLDLDSALPSSRQPDPAIFRDKPYWSPVYKYYTGILKKEEAGVSQIPGIYMNYLQLIFLVLHVKLFSQDGDAGTLNDLPASLDTIDPAFSELFDRIYREGKQAHASIDVNEIRELIFQKIIYKTIEFSPAKTGTPEVVFLKSNTSTVNGGDAFTLNWQLRNATNLEIYKNGIVIKKMDAGINSITLNEFYDGRDKDIEYSLVASNASARSKPRTLNIKITDKLQSSSAPAIISFTSDTETVNKGESFNLEWKLKNATRVELYKNDILFKKLPADNTHVKINEFYDGKDKNIEYSLLAFNDNGPSGKVSTTVRITDKAGNVSVPVDEAVAENDEVTEEMPVEEPAATNEPPGILSFNASAVSVQKGEKFTLQWEVTNATHIVIYKNKKVFKKLDASETSLATTAYFDEKTDDGLVYTLLAGNDHAEIKSDPVLVDIKSIKPVGWINPKKIRLVVFSVLTFIVLVVLAVVLVKTLRPKIEISDFLPDKITEDHTLVISGNNLPADTNKMQVIFNKIPGRIEYSSKNIMRVNVPGLADKLGDDNVEVALVFEGDTIYAPKKLMVTRDIVQVKKDTLQVVTQKEPVFDSPEVAVVKPKTQVVTNQVTEPQKDSTPAKVVEQPEVKKVEEPKKSININDLVKVTSNEFKRKALGGVKDLKLTVQNDSPYDLDNVNVVISYLKKNEREIKKETIVFSNVKAHTNSTIDVPDTHRGHQVSFNIVSINSKQLDADLKR